MAHKNDNNDSSFGKEKEAFCCVDVCACVLIPGGKLTDAMQTDINDMTVTMTVNTIVIKKYCL